MNYKYIQKSMKIYNSIDTFLVDCMPVEVIWFRKNKEISLF